MDGNASNAAARGQFANHALIPHSLRRAGSKRIDPHRARSFDKAAMRKIPLLLCCAALFTGCASGPVHDYYHPAAANPPNFKGDVTIEMVGDLDAAAKRCTDGGYMVIGASQYEGDQPTSEELMAQAKRVHASHVIYTLQPGAFGNMQMHVGVFGGSVGNSYAVNVIFLGK
jgi:hypothetical protein